MSTYQAFIHHSNEVASKNSEAETVRGSNRFSRDHDAAIKISNRKIDAEIQRLSNQNDDSYYDDLMS